ncbi:MAG: hypothetical protein ACK5OX_13415 [Desertimonas sp.]
MSARRATRRRSWSWAAAHLAVPPLLSRLVGRGRLAPRRVGDVYDGATLTLGAFAAANAMAAPAPRHRNLVVRALVGAAAGAALPTLVAGSASGRGVGSVRSAPAVRRFARRLRTIAVAVAEEAIWRRDAPSTLGTMTRITAFAALHVPHVGPVAARYHLASGAVFEAAARAGGVTASATAHAAHNLVVEHRDRRRRTRPSRQPVDAGLRPAIMW